MADKKPDRREKKKKAPKKKEEKKEVITSVKKKFKRKTKGPDFYETKRYLGKDVVVPVKYYGRQAGKGNYLAGMVNGKLVEVNKIPLRFREIGELR